MRGTASPFRKRRQLENDRAYICVCADLRQPLCFFQSLANALCKVYVRPFLYRVKKTAEVKATILFDARVASVLHKQKALLKARLFLHEVMDLMVLLKLSTPDFFVPKNPAIETLEGPRCPGEGPRGKAISSANRSSQIGIPPLLRPCCVSGRSTPRSRSPRPWRSSTWKIGARRRSRSRRATSTHPPHSRTSRCHRGRPAAVEEAALACARLVPSAEARSS